GYRGLEAKLARGFADEPGVDAIDRRLIHRLANSRQILPEFLLGDDADRVFAVVMGGAFRRERSLIFRLVPIFLIRERDGIDPLLAGIRNQTEEGAGINSGGRNMPTGTSASR